MKVKTESASRSLTRSIAMGVLLSMLIVYGVHVFAEWKVENYRPDPETTSTVVLHNKCAMLGKTHTLRPNTDVSAMGTGVDGTKLAASFMNFIDGHIAAMIILALVLGGIIFALRQMKKRSEASQSTM